MSQISAVLTKREFFNSRGIYQQPSDLADKTDVRKSLSTLAPRGVNFCASTDRRCSLRIHVLRVLVFVLACVAAAPCRAQDKVTILYDAFGESKKLTKDWGFSALVEHNGKRILFDTGNDAAKFEHNVKALGYHVYLWHISYVSDLGREHAAPIDSCTYHGGSRSSARCSIPTL
jgi:hypothetical protein